MNEYDIEEIFQDGTIAGFRLLRGMINDGMFRDVVEVLEVLDKLIEGDEEDKKNEIH